MYSRIMSVNSDPQPETLTRRKERHRLTFGEQLVKLRAAATPPVSQERLAVLLGRDRRAVQRWEKGKAPVELDDIEVIAAALGCGVGPLLVSLLPAEQVSAEAIRTFLEEAVSQQVKQYVATLTSGEFTAWIEEWSKLPDDLRGPLAELVSGYNRAQAAERSRLQALAEAKVARRDLPAPLTGNTEGVPQ